MNLSKAIVYILLIETGIAILSFSLFGFTEEGLQILTRISGRYSLLTFLTWMIFTNEKWIGKILSKHPFSAFAIVHGIHLLFVFCYLHVSGKTPVFSRLILGMITYAIIFIAPFFESSLVSKETNRSRILRRAYFLYLWAFFLMFLITKILRAEPHLRGSMFDVFFLIALILITLPLWIANERRKSETI
ncbi:hypothetical protein [Leptospira yasudae]|uniref:Uncharacterized protein n=1 Tax=Leptospira yasudae TaxID=2202201 RepID=A0A6N4QX03_9LEPT|nr:hypothetical protein [Leptospira yasudae]TGL76300.1 hypothetical protein EHQ72_13860 [Leptospira yasudae]TGL82446.1 hypothetical protein EHQ83_13995 [Leptospira yasudae]TGL84378.1 hypothetical protein EHQ77_00175 [Leptospira yasudae]